MTLAPASYTIRSVPPEQADFTPYGGNREFFLATDHECVVSGPAECIAGETTIIDAVTGETATIKELCDGGKAPMVQTLLGVFRAGVPFRKGVAALYRVTTESGHSFVATKNHLVLTLRGWRFVGSLQPGEHLLEYSPCPVPSNWELARRLYLRDVQRWTHTLADCQVSYSDDCRQCGGQFRREEDSAPTSVRQPSGVRGHIRDYSLAGDRAFSPRYNRTYQSFSRLSSEDCRQDCASRVDRGYSAIQGIPLPDGDLFQQREQYPLVSHRPSPFEQLGHGCDGTRFRVCASIQDRWLLDNALRAECSFQDYSPLRECSWCGRTHQECSAFVQQLSTCNPSYPAPFFGNLYYTVQQNKVSRIELERIGEYYDMTVPGAGHYFAEGFIHHNTGKTLAACWKVHLLASKYPGAQGAIVRKVQSSMPGSVLQTYARVIRGAPVQVYGGEHVEKFIYANGSVVWIGGMDNPDKVLSSERDFVYVNQAEELHLDDWEKLATRTTGRGAVIRHPQLLGDCNPGGSLHWIRERAKSGRLRLIPTTHRDNPTLYDPATGELTEQGKRTMSVLDGLTGVRRKRLLEGIWATSEGAVYDMFDSAVHVQRRDPAEFVRWIMAMDEGYTNPAVIGLIGIDSDGRIHLAREFYRRGVLQRDVVAQALDWHTEHPCEVVAVDNAAAGLIADLRDAGLPARGYKGRVLDGITLVQSYLKVQGDGKPRLTVDPACVETINEFESYVWKPEKDEPVKDNDHAMDMIRYGVRYLDVPAVDVIDDPFAGW